MRSRPNGRITRHEWDDTLVPSGRGGNGPRCERDLRVMGQDWSSCG